MRMAKAHWEELVAHARAEAPNECCGYLRLKDGVVEEAFRVTNERASPYGFDFGFEALKAVNDLEDAGFQVAVYHSHPRGPAEPSEQDRNIAQYPDWIQVIVWPEKPEVRAWWIADGRVAEEDLVVE